MASEGVHACIKASFQIQRLMFLPSRATLSIYLRVKAQVLVESVRIEKRVWESV
jgi:hypothetical protein